MERNNDNNNNRGSKRGKPTDSPTNPSPLDVLAEEASRREYLPVPEPKHQDLLTLAEAATKVLGDEPEKVVDNDDVAEEAIEVKASDAPLNNPADKGKDKGKDKDGDGDGDGDDDDEVVIVTIKKKQSTTFISDPPLLGGRRMAKATGAKKPKKSDKPENKAMPTSSTSFVTPSPTLGMGNLALDSPQSVASEPSTKEKCTACERLGDRAKCQVVKPKVYHGACMRCISRGETKKCSLYRG
jgi:hypothetical protein